MNQELRSRELRACTQILFSFTFLSLRRQHHHSASEWWGRSSGNPEKTESQKAVNQYGELYIAATISRFPKSQIKTGERERGTRQGRKGQYVSARQSPNRPHLWKLFHVTEHLQKGHMKPLHLHIVRPGEERRTSHPLAATSPWSKVLAPLLL